MKRNDVEKLDDEETRALDESFQPSAFDNRMRNIVISAVIASAVAAIGVSVPGALEIEAAMLFAYILITSLEKFQYARHHRRQASLVRKLVRRIEDLEGVQPTPLEAQPSLRATSDQRLQESAT